MALQKYSGPKAGSRVGAHEPFEATTIKEREFHDMHRRAEETAIAAATRFVGPDKAEDVVQEVALDLFRRWDELAPEAHTAAYFITAVRNRAFKQSLRNRRFEEIPDEDSENLPEPFHVAPRDSSTDEIPYGDVIERLVDALPERRRLVWELRFSGLSNVEIASRLDIDPQVVRKYMRMASVQLEAALQRSGIAISFETLARLIPARTSVEKHD